MRNKRRARPGSGGAWHQVSKDNRFLFRAVGGRNPGSNNTFDNGFPKMIWVANIEKLIASAADGSVDCNIDTAREIGLGRGDEADCPTLAGVQLVDDFTTGGPHWGALDNFQFTTPEPRPGCCSPTTSWPAPATTATTACT
jgi:hypothetical protein